MMLQIISAFLIGAVFSVGLMVAEMTNPAKVRGFLDLAGLWDPSLGLVMGGAIGIGVFAFTWVKLRKGKGLHAIFGHPFVLPLHDQLTRRLIVGSALFGVGWGLGGYCPGPALVGVGMGNQSALVFVAAMLAGMVIFDLVERGNILKRKA